MNLQQLKQKKLEEFYEKFSAQDWLKKQGWTINHMSTKSFLEIQTFLSSAMDEIQDATIKAAQEEILEPEKSMDIELIVALLEKLGLNPKNEQIDGFNRWIEFNTKYQKCWIEWYINVSTLRVGDKWGNIIPFTHVSLSENYPSNKTCLVFSNNAVKKALNGRLVSSSTKLTIEKLDWQESLSIPLCT